MVAQLSCDLLNDDSSFAKHSPTISARERKRLLESKFGSARSLVSSSPSSSIKECVSPRRRNKIREKKSFRFAAEIKQVRFAAEIKQDCPVLGRHEYSKAERKQCWYTSKERSKLHQLHTRTIERLENGMKRKRNTSYRGLEYRTVTGDKDLERRRVKCIDSVMDEQEDQWRLGVFDWNRFSRVSQKSSRECTSLAFRMAKRDELEALKVYAQDHIKSTTFLSLRSQARGERKGKARKTETRFHLEQQQAPKSRRSPSLNFLFAEKSIKPKRE